MKDVFRNLCIGKLKVSPLVYLTRKPPEQTKEGVGRDMGQSSRDVTYTSFIHSDQDAALAKRLMGSRQQDAGAAGSWCSKP